MLNALKQNELSGFNFAKSAPMITGFDRGRVTHLVAASSLVTVVKEVPEF